MLQGLSLQAEKDLLQDYNYDMVVGIDEAGRGPWAGPVAVGLFATDNSTEPIIGVTDSKKLSSKRRQDIFDQIPPGPKAFCLMATNKEIDRDGIGNAITSTMQKGIDQIISSFPDLRIKFLIDGYFKEDFGCEFELVKKGDSKYYSIAAASIIAKETRDKKMREYAIEYPEYGFGNHVGYGTKTHREALEQYGPCEIHRRSFKPVSSF